MANLFSCFSHCRDIYVFLLLTPMAKISYTYIFSHTLPLSLSLSLSLPLFLSLSRSKFCEFGQVKSFSFTEGALKQLQQTPALSSRAPLRSLIALAFVRAGSRDAL